jgi:Hemerythrin HHE cation binding domain
MRPSEVRDLVGRQHVQLRILFVEVRGTLEDDPRRAIERLVREVWQHLDMEDRVLVPALRELDAWGPVRAAEIDAEHARQRAELNYLRDLARHGERELAVEGARTLLDELVADMDAEERDLLDPDLLRDDVIVIDQSGG